MEPILPEYVVVIEGVHMPVQLEREVKHSEQRECNKEECAIDCCEYSCRILTQNWISDIQEHITDLTEHHGLRDCWEVSASEEANKEHKNA